MTQLGACDEIDRRRSDPRGDARQRREAERPIEETPAAGLRTTQPARHPQPTVKARALAYLRFERPDLGEAERFLTDFGLRVAERRHDALFFRATGPQPFCYVAAAGASGAMCWICARGRRAR